MLDNVVPEEDVARWFADGIFTADWTSPNFPLWMALLSPLREQAVSILEVGSWEGRSALFFLNFLPRCRLVCIDPFTGNAIHRNDPTLVDHLAKLEGIFDRNVASFGDRVEKMTLPSSVALPRLAIGGRRFDVAYVDGSHVATDVFRDAALLWPMMKPGGIVIFDDYGLTIDPNLADRPKVGIDAFLTLFEGQYQLLRAGWQIVVQKLESGRFQSVTD